MVPVDGSSRYLHVSCLFSRVTHCPYELLSSCFQVAARLSTAPWKVPSIATIAPWDGKDAKLEAVDEIDLSELEDIDVKDEL